MVSGVMLPEPDTRMISVKREGRGPTPSPGDFVIVSDGESGTVYGTTSLAPHIRALLPISASLERGHEAASAETSREQLTC
jgi:hypothetical protein